MCLRGPVQQQTLLPTYAKQDYIYSHGPAWLGASYNAFDIRGRALDDMTLRFPQERLTDRRSLLQSLDNFDRHIDQSGAMQALGEFELRAVDLVRGRAREAFDLTREDPKVRARYGKGKESLGEKLLLARRLAEAGVGLINVRYGSWDSHGTNPAVGHGTIEQEMHKYVPELDDGNGGMGGEWNHPPFPGNPANLGRRRKLRRWRRRGGWASRAEERPHLRSGIRSLAHGSSNGMSLPIPWPHDDRRCEPRTSVLGPISRCRLRARLDRGEL